MIEIIVNSKKFFQFEIDSYYMIFVNKRTKYFRICLRRGNSFDFLIDGYLEYFDFKRLPIVLKYLQSSSKVMEGEAIANRLLRMFLLAVNYY